MYWQLISLSIFFSNYNSHPLGQDKMFWRICKIKSTNGVALYQFSLHYCYVKITIFHPMVSKIKLRFYLKPGNREPMFECWDESGSEHPDSAGRSLSFPQPTRSWATGQPISTLYSFTDCESQGYSWRPEVSEEVFSPAGKFHSYHIYLGGWVGADCVIFFQEIESNLRSMEVQFGMNDFS